MSNLVALFNTQTAITVPAYLTAASSAATEALAGGFGDGRNRIGLKSARFRLIQGGQEIAVKDEPSLDVIILGANANVSRTFYAGKYDAKVKNLPNCWSPDGKVPHATVETPQHANCAQCPQNAKGSKIHDDGTKGRACSFSKRIAVMLHGDPDNVVYQMDIKALSIFGAGIPSEGKYSLSEYAKLVVSRGVRVDGMVTRLSFDMNSSVPKLYFTPQAFISEQEMHVVSTLAAGDDVKRILEVTADTVTDLGGDAEGPAQTAKPTQGSAAKTAAPVLAPAPTATPTPAPAPAPAMAPTVSPMDEDLEGMLGDLL